MALVCVLQLAENLTDRQAALAVSCRIDWKYCLGMSLDDTGFDHSVLSEFRDRLAEGDRADALSWLGPLIDAEWGRRYGRAARYDRLPKDKDELAEHVLRVGADGMRILEALAEPETPLYINRLPQAEVLRRV